MKRIFTLLFCAIALAGCSEFEVGNVDGLIIKYTTNDNAKADIDTSLFDRWSVSHRYENGVGIIEFKKPITSIPDKIFSYCNTLTSIELPGTITSIGEGAFKYCSRLKSVYCKAKTPPEGSSSMFSANASGRIINVPRESVDAYKTAEYWWSYADSIVGYDF